MSILKSNSAPDPRMRYGLGKKGSDFFDKNLERCRMLLAKDPPGKLIYIRERYGFALRLNPRGSMTFLHIFTLASRRIEIILGHYPEMSIADARAKHRANLVILEQKKDPRQMPMEAVIVESPPPPYTVERLIDEYCLWSEMNHVSKEGIRTIRKHIMPVWKDRLPNSIRRPEAISLIESALKTPGQARNIKKCGSALFNYAMDREIVDFNPFSGVSRAIPAIAPRSKTRYLSDTEIVILWNSTIFSREVKIALLLILVTGQRPGEVIGMNEKELETGFDGKNWWVIPAERIKTRKIKYSDHRVPLSLLAIRLLEQLSPQGGYFFPGKNGSQLVATLSHAVKKEIRTANGETKRLGYLGLYPWTPHDLRRTARTLLSKIGAPGHIKRAIQNHSKQGMDAVYDMYEYADEKRLWLSTLADYIESVVGKDVIPPSAAEGKLKKVSTGELKELVWRYPLTQIAEKIGVSEAAVRKRCDKDGVERPKQGYWLKHAIV
jgi:integrase